MLLLNASALGSAADAVRGLQERVEKEWDEGLESIRVGHHTSVTALAAAESSGSTGGTADDFWSKEAGYGEPGWVDNDNPSLAPSIARDEMF